MKMARSIIRALVLYIAGIVLAYGLGICFLWVVCSILFVWLRVLHMHADAIAYIMYHSFFFLGIPLGAPLGMLFVDKLLFRSARDYLWRIVTGFFLGVLGSAFVYWVFPFCGVEILDGFLPTIYGIAIAGGMEWFLLISVFFSLIGYNSVGLFRRDKGKLFLH